MDWHLGCPQALLNQAHTSSFTSVHSLHITLDGSPLRLKCNYIPPFTDKKLKAIDIKQCMEFLTWTKTELRILICHVFYKIITIAFIS